MAKIYLLDEFGCIENVFNNKREAAEFLEIPEGTVKSRCWRIANIDPKKIKDKKNLCMAKDSNYVRNQFFKVV